MYLHGTYYVCHCPTTLQEGSVTVVVSVRVARERTVGHACTAEINPSLVAQYKTEVLCSTEMPNRLKGLQ